MPKVFMMNLTPVSRSEISYFLTSSSAIVPISTSTYLNDLPLVQDANHLLTMSIFSGKVGALSVFESEIFAVAANATPFLVWLRVLSMEVYFFI